MSNNTNNSLTTMMSQFLKLETNALETYSKLNDAITSNKKTVDVDLFDENNNLVRIQIPSFGYIKNEISRLDNNVKNLSGTGDSDTNVKLSDGTYRKVITSKLKTSAKSITSVAVPTKFNSKPNWFFEEFMNPLLYVGLDVSGQIPIDTERIIVKRYILNLDTQRKIQYFNDNYKGKDGFTYTEFLNNMLAENISFILDEDTLDVPPRKIRYTGDFNVLKINNKESDSLNDGQTIKSRTKLYKLDKLTYTDLESGFTDSVSLKIGDSLIVNNDRKNTRYIVKSIDSTTNTISLQLIEGFDSINIGTAVISIYKGQDESIELEIPIGFNENIAIFVKSIDPISKIPSEYWSPGISFSSNELEILKEDGEVQNLETYYKNEVTDIGNILLGLAKDKIPPAAYGLEPNTPIINSSDFNIIQINTHLTDNDSFKEVQESNNEKNKISSEINELDTSIQRKRNLISTKKYSSEIEKQSDIKDLQNLTERRKNSSKLYSSIVNNIVDKTKNQGLTKITPKYRVRGFWPIPEPKASKYTKPQEIVQFIIQYRYLSSTGKPNNASQINFKDKKNVEKRGTFSNWNEIKSSARKRIKNEITGQYEWIVEDVENADIININQLDIPIQLNESVEIRIKSISEAGYPANPKESNWFESVIVNFPEELLQINNINDIKNENEAELARVKILEELDSKGAEKHLSDSFSANEYYFAHNATTVASGFLSAEQKPINLYDKLLSLENDINNLKQIIDRVTGELIVKILDDNGSEILIENNSSNSLFAGYYTDSIKDKDIKKGSIVSKSYFISIENIAATPLEIISRMPGNRSNKLPASSALFNDTGADSLVSNDTYYTTRGRYNRVPYILTNPIDINEYTNESPYQTSQRYGQYLYLRWFNVSGTENLYNDINIDTNDIIETIDDAEYKLNNISGTSSGIGNVSTNDYIWSGTYQTTNPEVISLSTITNSLYNQGLFVHWLHPNINNNLGNYTLTNAQQDLRITKIATLKASENNGKKQTGYFYDVSAERTIKNSFESNDQYLLGGKSCGSYLFIAVNNEQSLQVNGDDDLSSIKIKIGQNNAIQIPLIFQYRMTDFSGVGINGIGFIAGDSTCSTKDLTYSKKMGFDIKLINNDMFKFDIEVFAKYRNNNLNIDKIPKRDIRLAIEDMQQTLKGNIVPNIIERPTRDVSGIK